MVRKLALPRGRVKAKAKPKVKGKAAQKRVSAKISHLHKTEPGMPHKKMVAMAMSMGREHRLGPGGKYKPVKAKPKAKAVTKKKRKS